MAELGTLALIFWCGVLTGIALSILTILTIVNHCDGDAR